MAARGVGRGMILVRALTRVATPENEADLLSFAWGRVARTAAARHLAFGVAQLTPRNPGTMIRQVEAGP